MLHSTFSLHKLLYIVIVAKIKIISLCDRQLSRRRIEAYRTRVNRKFEEHGGGDIHRSTESALLPHQAGIEIVLTALKAMKRISMLLIEIDISTVNDLKTSRSHKLYPVSAAAPDI